MIITWGQVFTASLQNVWLGIADFIPTFLLVVVTIVIGWAVGAILCKFVSQIVKLSRIDTALKAAGIDRIVERSGFKLDIGMFLGKLVEWFVIVVFLVAALDILNLHQVTAFLSDIVLGYIPQVIVAALIILVAAVAAEVMQKIVTGTAKAANIRSANFAGNLTKWAIWIFAILAALMQLGIAVTLISTLFNGVVIALSLALGLAFGLGGQQAAAQYIEKVKHDISDR